MPPVKKPAYFGHLSKAKGYFGYRYVSAERVGKTASLTTFFGILSKYFGAYTYLTIPCILAWSWTSAAAKRGDMDQLLEDLIKSSSKVGASEIAESFLSRSLLSLCSRKGLAKMAAEFLVRLRVADQGKFEEVLEKLERSENRQAKRILNEFDQISRTSFTYRSSYEKARVHFAYAYLSARRIVRNAALMLALVHYTPVDDVFPGINFESAPFTFIAGTLAVFLGGALIADVIGAYHMRRRAKPNQLLDNLVYSSLNVEASTIAGDLAAYNRRGLKKMGKEYLLKLREACGTKFNQVLALLRESRGGRSLALSFVPHYRILE